MRVPGFATARHTAALLLLAGLAEPVAAAARLTDELGRNEVRVLSAPFELEVGMGVNTAALLERLGRLGYRRSKGKPENPGEFFWGRERFWIYQRAHQHEGRDVPPRLFALELNGNEGRILALPPAEGERGRPRRWIEPEILAESFTETRAPRRPIRFEDLPPLVWQAVLAAEDSRFFEHSGLDARGIARAMLANALAGKVVQGGSTITQQLVKMRDLTPKRTFGRKLSEAVRALELEADHDKEEILEAYLDHVYFGHVDGVGLYGLGAAADTYFGKPVHKLDLAESALLAAMIQGPNRLSPLRNQEAALERQQWVLGRLEELGWARSTEVRLARDRGLPAVRSTTPRPAAQRALLAYVEAEVQRLAPRRAEKGRGFVVETTLDPLLQDQAEMAVAREVERLRRNHKPIKSRPLAAALVGFDTASGRVLAYVPGNPDNPSDAFDRVRAARRQPGSAVKPLVLLEAFEDCGGERPLYPARRVSDQPLELPLADGVWRPKNDDGEFGPEVTLRQAMVESRNLPLVRAARWCGFAAVASRFEKAGLELPASPPPSFVLGAVETSPWRLAEAYSIFATGGRRSEAFAIERLARSDGSTLARPRGGNRRVVGEATAFLVRDLLRDAVARGTGNRAKLAGHEAWGKTGTSSQQRDAWFAGGVGSIVAVAWVGLDDGSVLGLSGAEAALPVWRTFMAQAAGSRPVAVAARPRDVEELWIEGATGLRVAPGRERAQPDLFRRGTAPPKRRLLLPDPPIPAID